MMSMDKCPVDIIDIRPCNVLKRTRYSDFTPKRRTLHSLQLSLYAERHCSNTTYHTGVCGHSFK